jgi:hypothetical protein
MTRLQTRAQRRAALEASSSSVRSAARRARIVSSVRPRAQRAKSPPAVRAASSREAEPAEPAADPPSLRRLLCLRCAKHAVVDPGSCCSFDKENSKMCSYCRGQKNKCLPVSILLSYFFLFSYANLSSSPPPWSLAAISFCGSSRSWPDLVRPPTTTPFGAGLFGLRPVSRSSRSVSRARRPRPRGKMLWLRPIFNSSEPPPPT